MQRFIDKTINEIKSSQKNGDCEFQIDRSIKVGTCQLSKE